MKLIIVLFVLLFPCFANASDKWDKTDITLQSLYTVLHVADYAQTYNKAKNNWQVHENLNNNTSKVTAYEESNFILSKYPNKDKVTLYFASTLVLHTLISNILPSDYRKIWQASTISLELYVVNNNCQAGAKFAF